VIVVDASVWVSLFVSADGHHSVTSAWFERRVTKGTPFAAPALVLAEIAGAVARRTGNPNDGDAVVRLVTAIPRLRLINVDRRVGTHAASLAAALRLRGTDAVYVAVADLLAVPLVTLDAEQVERARGQVATMPPKLSP
jgi:predicted nucleic acid-binding protein